LAEFFKDLLLRYYRRVELKIVMNDHCKLLTKCSYFLDIFIYIIYCDHDTCQPLGTPPYSICKWYHYIRVVVLGYKIHYRCRTTCMISTLGQSCNMGKKWGISLQTIFFIKQLLSRHVNQVGQKVAEMAPWWSSFRIW
jgi:hypothetical protein